MRLDLLNPGDTFMLDKLQWVLTDSEHTRYIACVRLVDGYFWYYAKHLDVCPLDTTLRVVERDTTRVGLQKPGDKFSWNTHVMILAGEYDREKCTHTCVNLKTGYTLPLHRETRCIDLEELCLEA